MTKRIKIGGGKLTEKGIKINKSRQKTRINNKNIFLNQYLIHLIRLTIYSYKILQIIKMIVLVRMSKIICKKQNYLIQMILIKKILINNFLQYLKFQIIRQEYIINLLRKKKLDIHSKGL